MCNGLGQAQSMVNVETRLTLSLPHGENKMLGVCLD